MSEVITPVTVIGDAAIGGTSVVDRGDISVVAGNLSAIDIVSNSITEINRYYTTFLGASATDPTVRVDGSALQVGDMYYSTTMPGMKVRGATAWATSAGGVPVNNGALTGNTSVQNLTVSGTFNANGASSVQNLTVSGTFNADGYAFKIPSGTTAERPTPASGQLRFNTTSAEFEGYNGFTWGGIGGVAEGSGSSATSYVRQTFTATAAQTTFTVSGGYTPGKIDVFKNGLKLVNGTTVTVTNGSTVVLSTGASAGDTIDVVGLASGYFSSPATPRRLLFTATAGQTLFSVSGGYTPNQLDVFQNGSKLVTGTHVDVSNGTSFTLVTPATSGDALEIVGFTAADTIAGTLKFQAGTQAAPSITTFDDTNTGIYFPAADTIAFSKGGAEAMRIDSSGNVGVGTASPDALLDVKRVNTDGLIAEFGSGDLAGDVVFEVKSSDSRATINIGANGGTGDASRNLALSTSGTERLRIDSSGNVGVGTASPSGRLTTIGSSAASAVNIDFGNAAAQAVGDAVTLRLLPSTAFVSAPTSAPYISAIQTNASTSATDIAFGTFNGSVLGERLRINSSGNVGIGTTSNTANSKLEVYGNSAAAHVGIRVNNAAANGYGTLWISNNGSNDGLIRGGASAASYADQLAIITSGATPVTIATNNTERLRIDSSGRVGIGTTSPIKELQINATEPTIRLEENGAGSKRLELSVNSSAEAKVFATQSGSTLLLGTVGTERLRIDSSGNVGVGTAAPDASYRMTVSGSRSAVAPGIIFTDSDATPTNYSLYINGNKSFTIYDSTAGLNRFLVDSSGNVGVGTSTAHKTLTVGSNDATAYISAGGNNVNLTIASIGSSGSVIFKTGGTNGDASTTTERLRIDSSGNLLVGTTSNFSADKMCLNFTSAQNGLGVRDNSNSSGANYAVFRNSTNGVIGTISRVTTTDAVAYNTTSDQRLKSNITDASPVLDKLMDVKVRQFDWTEGNLHQDAGFIAQELAPILSGIVTEGRAQEDWWQLDYARLTPYLVKAIQEQQAIITTLTARITALEAEPVAPEVVPTPEPEVVPAPEPEVVPTPEPEVVPVPEPELVPAPEPEVVPAPEPEVVSAPEQEAATPENVVDL